MMARLIGACLLFFVLSLLCNLLLNSSSLVVPASAAERSDFEVILQSGHSRLLSCMVMSPDARLMLTGGSTDNAVKLWDVEKAKEIRTLAVHEAPPIALTFSADGRRTYVVWSDGLISEIDITTGKRIKDTPTNLWTRHSAYWWGTRQKLIKFSKDSRFALFGTRYSKDKSPGFFIFWDLKKGREVKRFRSQAGMNTLCLSPNARWIVSATDNKQTVLWDINRQKNVSSLSNQKSSVRSLAFSHDNRFAAVACDDGNIFIWNINTKKIDRKIELGAYKTINQITFSKDGQFLYYSLSWPNANRGGNNPLLNCVNIKTGTGKWSFKRKSLGLDAMALSAGNRYLAVSYLGKREHISLLDSRTGRLIERFRGYRNVIQSVSFSKDGRLAATANYESYFSPKGGEPKSKLNIWALRKGSLSKTIEGLRGSIEPLVFSSNGVHLACGAPNAFIEIYDVGTGEKNRTLRGPKKMRPQCIAFSPDNKLIAATEQARNPHSASANEAASKGDIRIWDVGSGKLYKKLKDCFDADFSVIAFTTDGQGLIYKGMDDGIYTWYFKKNQTSQLFSFKSPHKIVGASSKYLILSDSNGYMSIWDMKSHRPLLKVPPHLTDGETVAVSSDGKRLLTTQNGRIFLWDPKGRRQIRSFEGHSRNVMALAFDSKKKRIFSANEDGSIYIWNMKTGQEIAQCLGTVGGGWIFITAEGYYNASLQGHEFLNIVQGLKVHGTDQFYDVFYRPDLVEMKLEKEDISEYLDGLTLNEALKNPPPDVKILNPKSESRISDRKVKIVVRIDDTGGGIGDVRLYHNGKLVSSKGVYRIAKSEPGESKGKTVTTSDLSPYQVAKRGIAVMVTGMQDGQWSHRMSKAIPENKSITKSYEISLIKGENTISASSFNGQNTVMSAIETITLNADVPKRKPRLFALIIGNNDFAGEDIDLSLAVKDAMDFAKILRNYASPLFSDSKIEVLADAKKPEIVSALDTMSSQMNPEDTFVFYVASHGIAHDDLYYILTTDYNGNLHSGIGTISSIDLMEYSKKLPSLKNIYVLDTCQSGGIGGIVSGLYDARISVLAKSLGMHVLAGAKSSEDALDNYKGNGLFTYFVLKGLKGDADKNKDKQVFVFEMGPYLTESVKKASKGQQSAFIRNFGDDFVISNLGFAKPKAAETANGKVQSANKPASYNFWNPLIERLKTDGFNEKGLHQIYSAKGTDFDPVPMVSKMKALYGAKLRSRRIKPIQERLAALDYDPGPVDGKMGSKTRKAILAYQHVHGLKLDGSPTQELLNRLLVEKEKAPPNIESLKLPVKAMPKLYASMLKPERIREAREFYNLNQNLLQQVHDRYGIPPRVAVGLLAMETRVGNYLGERIAFITLSSMAICRDFAIIEPFLQNLDVKPELRGWLKKRCGQKADWAYKELKALIQYAKGNRLNPVVLKGSKYGAIGICQFMPSNALKYGVDGDGDGNVDLFTAADALYSMANYMKHHGWQTEINERKALYHYNHNLTYVNTILALADQLR